MIHYFHRVAVSAMAGGIAMLAAIIGDAAAPIIHSDWLVDLRTVGTVGALVVTGTWWLGRKFQAIEDKLESAEEARKGMQSALAKLIEEHEDNHKR